MTVRTTVVQGQIVNPLTNRVVANKRLSVRLNPSVCYSLDGTQQIIRSSWITTDATGTFTDTFQVNADLDPAGSYYTVQVAPGLIDSLIVPYSVTPVTYRSCLVANPTNPNPIIAGISQDQLDGAVSTAVNGLLGTAAPAALDTLTELAAALGDDANFAATVTTSLAGKVPTSRTVAGHALSGDVTLVKGDVGLGSVDNTADTAKPVSTAQQTALNLKADTAALPSMYGSTTDLGTLQDALATEINRATAADEASTVHTHTESDVINLPSDLSSHSSRLTALESVKQFLRMTADQSVTSSTTFVNVTTDGSTLLAFTLAASTVYTLDAFLIYEGSTAGDAQFRWTMPSGCEVDIVMLSLPSTASSATSNVQFGVGVATGTAVGASGAGVGAGTRVAVRITATVIVGTTPGVLQFQMAQLASDATATILHKQSWARLLKES